MHNAPPMAPVARPPVACVRDARGPLPHGPPLVGLALIVLMLSGAACGEDRQSVQRRAEARREAARRTPLPLVVASTPENQALALRLGSALEGRPEPFRVTFATHRREEGIAALASGQVDMLLRVGLPEPTPKKPQTGDACPWEVLVIGQDAVAILANVTNRSGRLELDGIRDALLGRVTRWSEIRGDDLPLVLYALPAATAITGHLTETLLGSDALSVLVRQVPDVATQIESTRRTPGGLALVALHRLPGSATLPEGVKILPVARRPGDSGALATDAAANSRGDYPLRLPLVALLRRGDDPISRRLAALAARVTAQETEAWLNLPPAPAADREHIRKAWTHALCAAP